MVTGVLTAYDGGKYMVGYSTFDNWVSVGWLLKLFGTDDTGDANKTKCTAGDKPTGY
jgi:hypothetical protein